MAISSVILDSAYLATSGLKTESGDSMMTVLLVCNMLLFLVDAFFIMHLAFCYTIQDDEQLDEILAAMQVQQSTVRFEERKVYRPERITIGMAANADPTCSICLCDTWRMNPAV